jgi:hypothetical protein
MRKFMLTLSAAALMAGLLAGATALPASAHLQENASPASQTHAPNATVLAREATCGGPSLRCPAGYAKVCNPANGKCCCAIPGTYH